MVIRVYISGNSGNKEIVTHQQRIFMILNSLSIPNEPVDISAPGMEKERDYMREKAKKKEGQRHALPPQIFNDKEYRGDYDDFDIANEDDKLEEFLGILKNTPAVQPEETKPEETKPVSEAKEEKAVDEENTPEETQTDQDQVPLAVETPVLEPAPETDHEDPAEPEAGTEPEPEAKPEPQPAPEALPEEPPVESESIPNFPEEKGKDLDSKVTCLIEIPDHDTPEVFPEPKLPEVEPPVINHNDEHLLVQIMDRRPELPESEHIVHPGTDEYDKLMQKKIQECEEDSSNLPPDIPALGPYASQAEEPPTPKSKKSHLNIEIDEARANAGFQNIMNAARFWKASQLMGTP